MTPAIVLIDSIDRALPFLTVSPEASARTTWFADVHARAEADPLAPWRDALQRIQGPDSRPHIAAAFVLQWFCEIAATPMTYAAELASTIAVPSAAGLGFELAVGLHPERVVLDPARLDLTPVEGDGALGGAWAAYEQLVAPVVTHFAPEVKMSSRQRWGVVSDVWRAAAHRARGAAGRPTGPAPRRVSCCFIVGLPGMVECSTCPRGG